MHWNKGGAWKKTVQEGKADVMTLATREDVPDPCIPKFVQLAVSLQRTSSSADSACG
jgi:hypothetical protein